MGFWNFFGLSSKKDNDQLVAQVEQLRELLNDKIDANNTLQKDLNYEGLKRIEELNSSVTSLLTNTAKVIEKQNDANKLFVEEHFGKQENQLKKLQSLIKQNHSYTVETLNAQNLKVQEMEEQLKYLEKLNEELVKSMQSVWLVQLSQQIDKELTK
ncbi:hypothetical protein [Niallia sp. MER TA 168]|uniref:hypothetical protein n=1 Tax=Niallia sp. MER TA 168 TaxID=2939568 RepID=UPI00203F220A|nr:hypothetical protein [Niallia sp. MER TA 168]MCM3360356.1 hypothetical protein [Niallia sp. MER TA 168]